MTAPTVTVTKPPYNLATLHTPLSPIVRTRLLNWYRINTGIILNNKGNDNDLLTACRALASGKGTPLTRGGILGIASGIQNDTGQAYSDIKTPLDFLKQLAELVLNPVRMGELLVGVILVGVGVNAILKNPAGKVKTQATRVAAVIPK